MADAVAVADPKASDDTAIAAANAADEQMGRRESKELFEEEINDAIRNYGSSSHTAWFENQHSVLRREDGLIGFVQSEEHAVVWSDPLAQEQHWPALIDSFLDYCHDEDIIPVWINANKHLGELLQAKDWSVLTCAQEDVLDPTTYVENANIRQMVTRAIKYGASVSRHVSVPDASTREGIEECIASWKGARKGLQVFSTLVRPFICINEREWFVAHDSKTSKICGVLTLHHLPARGGWAVEHSITAPNAPKGTSELLLTSAIRCRAEAGEHYFTFGVGAARTLTPVHGMESWRARWCAGLYDQLARLAGLSSRGSFRSKFGTRQEPLYVSFPRGKMGARAVKAILRTIMGTRHREQGLGVVVLGGSNPCQGNGKSGREARPDTIPDCPSVSQDLHSETDFPLVMSVLAEAGEKQHFLIEAS